MLTEDNHIRLAPVAFQCPSDEEAIAHVQQYRDGADMELWQLGRKVARIPKLD